MTTGWCMWDCLWATLSTVMVNCKSVCFYQVFTLQYSSMEQRINVLTFFGFPWGLLTIRRKKNITSHIHWPFYTFTLSVLCISNVLICEWPCRIWPTCWQQAAGFKAHLPTMPPSMRVCVCVCLSLVYSRLHNKVQVYCIWQTLFPQQ